jgi:hypothetical protein
VKECDWQRFVGIGYYRQIRGKGISASFVAPLVMPAAGDGASVHVAALGAPHVDVSSQAKRICLQNRGVRW